MIIICYQTRYEDGSIHYCIRATQRSNPEINTSKLYISKAALSSDVFSKNPPNSKDILMSISWKYFSSNSNTPISFVAPVQVVFENDAGSYWVYSLSCSAYIPYYYPETEKQISGRIDPITIQTQNGKIIFDDFSTTEEYLPVGSHYEDQANNLIDEHNSIVINDNRTIAYNSVTLIEGDWLSQQVTFEMDEQYDGISVLNDDVKVWVNFIPVDYVPEEGKNPFLSDQIQKANIRRKDLDSPTILMTWNVPGTLTKKAGIVPYNLAVTASSYYWQTRDSSFNVLKSQFVPFNNFVDEPLEDLEDPLSALAQQIKTVDQKLTNLQSGKDTTFAQNIGEYLATDSTSITGSEESAEIIFDANMPIEEV